LLLNKGIKINKISIFLSPVFLRGVIYLSVWYFYILFMNVYAPLGTSWLDWHEQRISNFIEFLDLNGLLAFNGFGIWSTCVNCDLTSDQWNEKIYMTHHSVSFMPYLILNYLFGNKGLLVLAPMMDKFIIFISGSAVSEIAIRLLKDKTSLPKILISSICFCFFIVNPWTYKMLLAAWTEIYFLAFILYGFIAFSKKYYGLGLFLFFCAAIFQYQWAFLISIFYLIIISAQFISNNQSLLMSYLPILSFKLNLRVAISLLIPVLGIIFSRVITQSSLSNTDGSDFFFRVGISGQDMHNGGLLGSLQFLGGNRITKCFENLDMNALSSDLDMKIFLFNCILSIASMIIISIVSIAGTLKLVQDVEASRKLLAPLLFSLITMICIFQQSLSVHLMGYSYIFSPLFSLGLTAVFLLSFNSLKSNVIRIIFIAPLTLGILITCIRVNMLTGIGG